MARLEIWIALTAGAVAASLGAWISREGRDPMFKFDAVTITGKCSTFGGSSDGPSMGNARPDWMSEGLALWEPSDIGDKILAPLLAGDGVMGLGLARQLDPRALYVACRWNYDVHPRRWLRRQRVIVYAPDTDRAVLARPVDWGPAEKTGRDIDVSPGAMRALGVKTDAVLRVTIGGAI